MTSLPLVCHVITSTAAGGAENQLLQLVRGGEQTGVRHRVICLGREGVLAPELARAGSHPLCLGLEPGPGALLRGLPRLAALLRRLRPELVQSWLYHADLMGLLASRLAGCPPLIWTLRCSDMDLSRYFWATRLVLKANTRLSRLPAAIVANSHSGARWHADLGYFRRRLLVIPNGFDTRRFRPDPGARRRLRRRLGLEEGHLLVGHLARWDPMKDQATLLEGFALALAEEPRLRLLMLGPGLEEGNPGLAACRRPPLAGRCFLLGYQARVEPWLAALDLHLLSSRSEGLCNAVGETMAAGVPNLVTDTGDNRRLVGDTGLVVAPGRPRELARALLQMAAWSEDRRRRRGQAARRRIQDAYSLAAMRSAYAGLYRHLLGGI